LRTFYRQPKLREPLLLASLALLSVSALRRRLALRADQHHVRWRRARAGNRPTLINPWGGDLQSVLDRFARQGIVSRRRRARQQLPFGHGSGATSAQPHDSPAGAASDSDGNLFKIPNSSSAIFLFGNLDGSIAAWNASTPQAVTVINNPPRMQPTPTLRWTKTRPEPFSSQSTLPVVRSTSSTATSLPPISQGHSPTPRSPQAFLPLAFTHQEQRLHHLCGAQRQRTRDDQSRPGLR